MTTDTLTTDLQHRARQLMVDSERQVLNEHAEAQKMLDAKNYSAAATACHQAYQHSLRAEAYRSVLS